MAVEIHNFLTLVSLCPGLSLLFASLVIWSAAWPNSYPNFMVYLSCLSTAEIVCLADLDALEMRWLERSSLNRTLLAKF